MQSNQHEIPGLVTMVSKVSFREQFLRLEEIISKLTTILNAKLAVNLFDEYVHEHEAKRQKDGNRGRDLSTLTPTLATFQREIAKTRIRPNKKVSSLVTYCKGVNIVAWGSAEYVTLNQMNELTEKVNEANVIFEEIQDVNIQDQAIDEFARALIFIYHNELNRGYYGDRGSKATCSLYRKVNTFFANKNILSRLSIPEIALYFLCRIRQESSGKELASNQDAIDRLTRLLTDSDGNLRDVPTITIMRAFMIESNRLSKAYQGRSWLSQKSTIVIYLKTFLSLQRIQWLGHLMRHEIDFPDQPFSTISCYDTSKALRATISIKGVAETDPDFIQGQFTTNLRSRPITINMKERLIASGLTDVQMVSTKLLPIQGVDYVDSTRRVVGKQLETDCYLLVTVRTNEGKYVHAFFQMTAALSFSRQIEDFVARKAVIITAPSDGDYINAIAVCRDDSYTLIYACEDSVAKTSLTSSRINICTSGETRSFSVVSDKIDPLVVAYIDPRVLAYDNKIGVIFYDNNLLRLPIDNLSEENDGFEVLFSPNGDGTNYHIQQISPTYIPGQYYISWTYGESKDVNVGLFDLEKPFEYRTTPLVILNTDVAQTYRLTEDGINFHSRDTNAAPGFEFRCVSEHEFHLVGIPLEQPRQEAQAVPTQRGSRSIMSFLRDIGGHRGQERADNRRDDHPNDNTPSHPTTPGYTSSDAE